MTDTKKRDGSDSLDVLVGILEACIQGCDTGIPYYAYGDNQAACEMAHRLSQIADDLTNALDIVNSNDSVSLDGEKL